MGDLKVMNLPAYFHTPKVVTPATSIVTKEIIASARVTFKSVLTDRKSGMKPCSSKKPKLPTPGMNSSIFEKKTNIKIVNTIGKYFIANFLLSSVSSIYFKTPETASSNNSCTFEGIILIFFFTEKAKVVSSIITIQEVIKVFVIGKFKTVVISSADNATCGPLCTSICSVCLVLFCSKVTFSLIINK